MAELCRHFGTCGGCVSQDLSDEIYVAGKREHVRHALARKEIDAPLDPLVRVPEGSRRRASLKAKKSGGQVAIGFHAAGSHAIVDMHACRVLTHRLFGLVGELRRVLSGILHDGEAAELHLTEAGNGFDLALRWSRKDARSAIGAFAQAMTAAGLVRVTANGDLLVANAEPVVGIGRALVDLPPESFLQPTREGEASLQALVREGAKGAKTCADLFAGCGTLSLVLAEKQRVHAVEFDRPMLAALDRAAKHTQGLKPVSTEQRDLFRRPLSSGELGRFDVVVLDPPRAGAEAQSRQLAASHVRRVIYVSCEAASFSRDARILLDAGYRIERITPVDQFLWSEHIELVGVFARGK
jgi:23S rRNA (uracil1939-C5)-methyltransferase